jgi:hypothetical protein
MVVVVGWQTEALPARLKNGRMRSTHLWGQASPVPRLEEKLEE